ncbi:GNAT family N-acetyltransferase [Amycolatopsis sp., V23-08]|uniref:GNAT family N-acetyltransferase n=1 Tax=Amycolatopsis heterodermiae TaxID=3110235 RepID=A0ABU5R8C4_9PSEU|nr:GNAT family N-acetyltransferase [Amycolatopsis sp., V23-08]MEA5361894.1 GNAT family N-acetyltransferase [Amycolatopsis sp., V23-08]
MPTLHTERLTLVPLADEHRELEYELDSDPEVMRYLTGRASTRAEVEAAHRRRMAVAPGFGFWMGFASGSGSASGGFVGWWILRPPQGPDQPFVEGEAELGYRLLRRHWRQGYASEGSRELLRYGFADLGLERIFAQTMAVNTPSRATMASVGLTFARSFISAEDYAEVLPGAEQGEVEYEITRTRWLRELG